MRRLARGARERREFCLARPWACSMSPGGLRRTPLEKRGGAPARAAPRAGTGDSVNTSGGRRPQIPDSQIAPRTALRNVVRRARRPLPGNQLDFTEIFYSSLEVEGPTSDAGKTKTLRQMKLTYPTIAIPTRTWNRSRLFHALSTLFIKVQRFVVL